MNSQKDQRLGLAIQPLSEIAHMQNAAKIVSARITAMPRSFLDPLPEVHATLEDGSEEMLFSYYPDEISFSASEFVGLTLSQANQLKQRKDVAYLRS